VPPCSHNCITLMLALLLWLLAPNLLLQLLLLSLPLWRVL
jgi:hypothetical protein